MVHVNLIKLYHSREKKEDLTASSTLMVERLNFEPYPESLTEPEPHCDSTLEDLTPVMGNPLNSYWLSDITNYMTQLSSTQVHDISSLLTKLPQVTTDLPGTCKFMNHDIELLPGTRPIK